MMLKKMRWRFVSAAMSAFVAVILILLLVVNLWNYSIITSEQDETLDFLSEVDYSLGAQNGRMWMEIPGGRFSKETPYTTRFFAVYRAYSSDVSIVYQEYIASVSTDEALAYADAVFERSGDEGYYRDYRYRVTTSQNGETAIFLNSEQKLASMRSLLLASIAVAVISSLAVFLLVILFSKRAIAPYIRNIETQKRFITDAGHELKTPITAISTSADILAMELEDNEWVNNIRSQSARLAKLVTNLVTLSRLDEDQPFPERSEFSLSDAVWEISEPIAAIAGAQGKRYVQNIEDGVTIVGDRNAIQQMVSILLDNAVKYSADGALIELDVHRHAKRAEITVRNGCDIEDYEHVDKLFDRFYRPDSSRSKQTGGTGIGLSIAKSTAEAHGGTITAESPDGKSITFRVII